MDDTSGSGSALLDALDPVALAALTDRLRPRYYQRGQVLFNDGDHGDCLHLVRSGRLNVQVTTAAGQTVVLRVVHPGEVVGELALVRLDHRRTGRVVALEDTRTSALYQRDFEELRQVHPAVDRFLVSALCERVVRTSELVLDLLRPPEQRVWRRLALLAEAYGDEPIRMSQDELAHASGTVRQTVNRVLRSGSQDGSLEVGRGVIRVVDRARVARQLTSGR
jgi:CRP/FNR family transcriptional regulator, cyclic AMP receptor protein